MNRLQSEIAFLTYRKAIMIAEKAHKETGRRYFVLPNIDTKIKLIVTDRKNFRELQRKHYISQSLKMNDIFNLCFYHTADKSEKNGLTEEKLKEKQIMYQDWYDQRLANLPEERKIRRQERRKRLAEQFRSVFRKKK